MIKLSNTQSLIFSALSGLILLFIFWAALAPSQLGGRVVYVIVDGNSMEPGFHRGDLVLVRTGTIYRVGDAVVYRNAEMSSFVFHRIIGTNLDHYILQGDNNSWLDSYQPVQDEIVGKLWLHIPKIGKAIEWTRVPINTAVAAGLLGGVLMFDMIKKPSRSKRKVKVPTGSFDGVFQSSVYASAFLALSFLLLGIYSFTRPLNSQSEGVAYEQVGNFYYSATGTPGVYDTEIVRTGEPIFPKLTCFLNIGFTYNVAGNGLQNIAGRHGMYARVLDEQSGWQRTIPLSPETSFIGNTYFSMATLDLCQVESLVNLVEQQAGLNQIVYTLEVFADTSFSAGAAGASISDSFSPNLAFKYDKVHFYLAANDAETSPLVSSKHGVAGDSASESNIISLVGFHLPVWAARYLSLIGFILSLLGLAIAGMNIYNTASQDNEALIRLKYGALLVNVHEQNLAPSSSTIDVTTMDDLARLADRHGAMILHMTQNLLHHYLVQSNGITYRYVVSSGKNGGLETELSGKKVVSQMNTVVREPAVVHQPVRAEPATYEVTSKDGNALKLDLLRMEKTQPVVIQPRPARIARPKPAPRKSIEYVIDTGIIECVLPEPDTKILRRIKI
ncbi:MAG TPA: signal peptidase I [Anaerolineae bacterium]|nr:signal peptidase I [Anaerolineae bacterium]